MKGLSAALAVFLAVVPALMARAATERDAVFQQMLAHPGDTALMLRYARLSAEERDYETAVSTLERLIDLEPDAVDARYQLALAYFALGSDDVANYHLAILQRSGALTSDETTRVGRYQGAIDRRQRRQDVTGFVELGAARLTGIDSDRFIGSYGLTHRYDLGDAHQTQWITDLRVDFLGFGTDSLKGRNALMLTTGPMVRLSGEQYGSMLRPYLSFRGTRGIEVQADRLQYGVGLSYENPLSAQWSVFAGVEGGRLTFRGPDLDGTYREGQLGAEWRPTATTRVKATVFGRRFDTGTPVLDSAYRAARLDVSQRFRPGMDAGGWLVSAHVQKAVEDFDTFQRDEIMQYGASVRYYATSTFYVETGAERYKRTSNAFAAGRKATTVGLKVGMEF